MNSLKFIFLCREHRRNFQKYFQVPAVYAPDFCFCYKKLLFPADPFPKPVMLKIIGILIKIDK
jgi:hypothetical protein